MNFSDIMAEIKKGQIRRLYLLFGEEHYLIRQVEQAVTHAVLLPEERDMNLIVLGADVKPAELIGYIETIPFLGGKNVVVVNHTAWFRSRKGGASEENGEEAVGEAVDYVERQLIKVFENMPDYCHVILKADDKVDKRRKLFKVLEKQGAAVELPTIKAKDVRSWATQRLAEEQVRLTADAAEYLFSVISMMPQISLGFLDKELEKLVLYLGEKKTAGCEAVRAVFSSVPEVSVFAMLDAITQKEVRKALELLEDQLSTGEQPLRLLALLAREVRILWQTVEMTAQGYDSRMIAEKLGVPPFIGEKKMKQSRSFSRSVLRQALLSLAQADRDLKVGRTDSAVLEKIIIEMCM